MTIIVDWRDSSMIVLSSIKEAHICNCVKIDYLDFRDTSSREEDIKSLKKNSSTWPVGT